MLLGFVHLRPQSHQKSPGNVSATSRHALENGQIFGHLHSHNGIIAPKKTKLASRIRTFEYFAHWGKSQFFIQKLMFEKREFVTKGLPKM